MRTADEKPKMSNLLKIVYDVAAIRTEYLRLHRRLFHMSAGRLLHNLARRGTHSGLTDRQQLGELTRRLSSALDELTQLTEENISIRRGSEIRVALCAYARALSESMTTLDALLEIQQQPTSANRNQPPGQSQAIRIAYDDAVQYQNRLGARLNALLTTL